MTQTFRDYMAGRKLPYNAWGDMCRFELKRGTLPSFESWQELRTFVERYPGLGIDVADARAAWHGFRSAEEKARRRGLEKHHGAAPENLGTAQTA